MPPKQRPQGSGSKSKSRSRQRTDKASFDRRLLYLGGAAGTVVVAAVLGWLLLGGGTEDAEAKARTALETAGCTLTVVPAVRNESDHSDVANPDLAIKAWNTDPPTSGPHYGETAIFGAYEEPLQQARVLHNLEHGAVSIQYGDDVPDATVDELRSFYDDNQNGTILAPYPKLGKQIALGAWVDPGLESASSDRGSGVLAKCPRFDETAFESFLDAFQFKGPERFPADSMLPGGN
jgi:hypothetical protein